MSESMAVEFRAGLWHLIAVMSSGERVSVGAYKHAWRARLLAWIFGVSR